MAFLNPTINAYRRLEPDSLAPTHGNWGVDNRTTFVRVPPDRGPASRIEVRALLRVSRTSRRADVCLSRCRCRSGM